MFQVTVHFVMELLHFQADFPILIGLAFHLICIYFLTAAAFWMTRFSINSQSCHSLSLDPGKLFELLGVFHPVPYTDQHLRSYKILPASYQSCCKESQVSNKLIVSEMIYIITTEQQGRCEINKIIKTILGKKVFKCLPFLLLRWSSQRQSLEQLHNSMWLNGDTHVAKICSLKKGGKNVITWRDTLELNETDIVLEKSHSVPRMII